MHDAVPTLSYRATPHPSLAPKRHLDMHLADAPTVPYLNRDVAYDIGLPACGRTKNLGGRMHELRRDGWDVETEIRRGVLFYAVTRQCPSS